MKSIDTRRARVEELYALRGKINAEIERVEDEIAEEIIAMRRAKGSAFRAGVRVARRKIAKCGTDGGYYRHIRTLNERACEACKLAHRVAEREREARRNTDPHPCERCGIACREELCSDCVDVLAIDGAA